MSSDDTITQALQSQSDPEILQLTLTPPDSIPRQAATALKVASVLLTHLSSDLLQTETDIETNLINMVTPGHPLATQFAAAYHRIKKRDHGREYGAYEELRAAAQSGDVREGEDDDDEYESSTRLRSPPRRRQHGATIAASSSAAATSKRRSSTLSTASSRHVRQRTAPPSPPLQRALQPAFADPTSDSESEPPWEPIDIQRSRAAAAATTSPWSPIRHASPTSTTSSNTDGDNTATINMDPNTILSSPAPSGSSSVGDPYESSPTSPTSDTTEAILSLPRIGAATTTSPTTIQSTTHIVAPASRHIPTIDIPDDDELESKYHGV